MKPAKLISVAVSTGALLLAAGARDASLEAGGVRSMRVSKTSPQRMPADTARVKLDVRGMTCGSCALTARLALERVEGVHRAEVSYDSASAVVWYDPATTSPEVFIARLREMTGYEARVVKESDPPKERP